MTDCHAKVRFASKEFAELSIREHQAKAGYRAASGMQHRAYWCVRHGCWHTGNSTSAQHLRSISAGEDALALIQALRLSLVNYYGQTKDVRLWSGVRALTGAMKHLQANP